MEQFQRHLIEYVKADDGEQEVRPQLEPDEVQSLGATALSLEAEQERLAALDKLHLASAELL